MEDFTFNIINDRDPLVADPFYAWCDANLERSNLEKSRLAYAIDYLDSLGFVKGKHKVSERDLKTLEYVFETWVRTTPYYSPCKFSDLFTDGDAYYVSGAESYGVVKPWRRNVTPKLVEMVRNAQWIYDVEPNSTYFELNGNRLYAKYQQILGSRFLCFVEE